MQIDHCLILAAGQGTRMGAIGKKLPKVLWPVFEKSLLELQVGYAKSLRIPKIFVNLHFMGEEIGTFCSNKPIFDDVEFVWEKPEILDIGGAIHNIATKVKYSGKLLILNADQFFYIKKDDLSKILKPFEKSSTILFSYWVNSSLGYNALDVDSDRMVRGIIKNEKLLAQSRVETYTGISVIDLKQLKPVVGKSSFFDSVCIFEKNPVPTILLEKIEYWDFGTVKRYWETMQKVLSAYSKDSTHPFLRFLVQERALKTWKINLIEHSYHARSPGVINLNPDPFNAEINPSVILDGDAKRKDSPHIWWKGIEEEVK